MQHLPILKICSCPCQAGPNGCRCFFTCGGAAHPKVPEGKSPPRMRYSHRPLAMPPLCKGRWQKYSIFDGGVADTGCDANLDVSIPQSALRLPAPFPQGSRGMRDGHTAHHRNCCALSKPSPPGEGFGRGSPGRAEAQRRSPVCVTSGTSSVFLYLRAKCGLMRKEKR